jgi:hypothetical protein
MRHLPVTPQQLGDNVTINDLRNTIKFLQRLVVGQSEQDTFFKTLKALETELQRRTKK